MGIKDWFRRTSGASSSAKLPRFVPVSAEDEMLLPHQIEFIKTGLDEITTEILGLQDPSDPMLPECNLFVPNLLGEFNENPKLAMIHALGKAHAWIDVRKLREIFAADGSISDYRALFNAFCERGYDVKKIKYIRFESALDD